MKCMDNRLRLRASVARVAYASAYASAYAGACAGACASLLLLSGCTEVPLNDAPVVDMSRPVGATVRTLPGVPAPASATGAATGATPSTALAAAPVGAAVASGAAGMSVGGAAIAPDGAPASASELRPLEGHAPLQTRALEAVPGAPAVPAAPAAPAASAASAAPAALAVPAVPVAPAVAPLALPAGLPADKAPRAPGAGEGAGRASEAGWVWPVEGKVVKGFDPAHGKGIDIAAAADAAVVASADGDVSYVGSPKEFGNLVVLLHEQGMRTAYGQLKAASVAQGQHVRRGQVLGSAQGSAAPVHFELRRKGVPVDPLPVLPPRP
jgi:lipoprotein NlpD